MCGLGLHCGGRNWSGDGGQVRLGSRNPGYRGEEFVVSH